MKNRNNPRDPEHLDPELIEAISANLQSQDISNERRRELFARVETEIGFGPAHQFFSAEEGIWRILGERVYLKVIQRDELTGSSIYLVKYGPKTSFPRHPQRTIEECLLISGDLKIGTQEMKPGDIQIAVPGLEHGPLVSKRGALVYVRGVLSRLPSELAPASEVFGQ